MGAAVAVFISRAHSLGLDVAKEAQSQASVCLSMGNKLVSKRKLPPPPMSSVYQFLWYKQSHHGPFEALNMMSAAHKIPENVIFSQAINVMSMAHTICHITNYLILEC